MFNLLSFLLLPLLGSINSQSYPEVLTSEEEEKYLKLLQQKDENARATLIEHNLRLVAHIVKKFENSGEDKDDLLSIGAFGLIKAVDTYKFDSSTKLATYAAKCIENEILMCLRKNNKKKFIDHVEVYNQDGIYYFIYEGGKLIPDEKKPFENYFTITDSKGNIQGYNWLKIPLVPFKFNAKEIPLIRKLKSLQDGLNLIESNFLNQMEEDVRNTILVLVNYDGQNLAEFRKNLAEYGTVKVKTIDGAPGDLKTLQIEVNSENYKVIIDLFKKAIIENARGYDAKDDRLGNNPNQMNIQSIFSDIDLDANGTETEYQAAFEEVLWFINCHLANTGCGNFENENVDIIFNRDMLISESEIIDNINKSSDLSLESRLAQHPWVDDVQAEMDRIEKEKKNEIEQYPFPNQFGNNPSKTQPNEGGDVIDGEQE